MCESLEPRFLHAGSKYKMQKQKFQLQNSLNENGSELLPMSDNENGNNGRIEFEKEVKNIIGSIEKIEKTEKKKLEAEPRRKRTSQILGQERNCVLPIRKQNAKNPKE